MYIFIFWRWKIEHVPLLPLSQFGFLLLLLLHTASLANVVSSPYKPFYLPHPWYAFKHRARAWCDGGAVQNKGLCQRRLTDGWMRRSQDERLLWWVSRLSFHSGVSFWLRLLTSNIPSEVDASHNKENSFPLWPISKLWIWCNCWSWRQSHKHRCQWKNCLIVSPNYCHQKKPKKPEVNTQLATARRPERRSASLCVLLQFDMCLRYCGSPECTAKTVVRAAYIRWSLF